jgi:hypothetical protein
LRTAESLYASALKIETTTIDGLTEKQNILTKALNRAQIGTDTYKTIQQALLEVKRQLTKATDAQTKSEEESTKAIKKAAEERAKFLEKLRDLEREIMLREMPTDKAEIEKLKDKYKSILQEAKKHGVDLLYVQKLYQEELAQLEEKQLASENEKRYRASLETIDKLFEEKQRRLNEQKLADLNNAISTGQSTQEIEQFYADSSKILEINKAGAKAQIAKYYAETVKTATADAEKFQKDSQDKLLAHQTDVATRMLNAHVNMENAKTEKSRSAAEEWYEIWSKKIKQSTDDLQPFINEFLNLYNTINQISAQQAEIEIQQSREENERKKEDLQQQLDRKFISQKRYNSQVAKLEQEQREKEREIKKEQFEKDKAFRIVQAVINTALGVTNAFATSGNIYAGIALAALVAATGAAQIALISEQQPTFRKGGIFDGPSHEQGGMPVYSRGKKVAELEGGEPILSRETYHNNRQVVDALLYSSMYQGGKPVDISRLMSTNKFNAGGILPVISKVKHFETGGVMPLPNNSSDSVDINTQILMGIYESLQKPVPAILTNEQFETERERIYKARNRGNI